MATVGRGADQYTVRFPDGLRDRIKAAAEANNRSMNAEIVATLEEKYPAPDESMEAAAWRQVKGVIAILELKEPHLGTTHEQRQQHAKQLYDLFLNQMRKDHGLPEIETPAPPEEV